MDHQGHGMDLNHAIFQTPNKVAFEYVEQPRPKHYEGAKSPLWPKGVPATYKLAQFEHKKPPVPNPTWPNTSRWRKVRARNESAVATKS